MPSTQEPLELLGAADLVFHGSASLHSGALSKLDSGPHLYSSRQAGKEARIGHSLFLLSVSSRSGELPDPVS